jgi:hypothetical protein
MRENSSSSVAVRGTSAVMPDTGRPSATDSSATARFVAAEAEPAWDLSDFAVARSDLHRVDVVGGAQLAAAGVLAISSSSAPS